MVGGGRYSRHFDSYNEGTGYSSYGRRYDNDQLQASALEDELELQNREIHNIVTENHHVIEENTELQRELEGVKDAIHRMSNLIVKVREDADLQRNELFNRNLKMEAEIRGTEPVRAEVIQLRSEVKNLNAVRKEISTQLQTLTRDINHLQADNQQLKSMMEEMDAVHKDIIETRKAAEYTKKGNEEHVEQSQVMQKNLTSMAHEIEKLRAQKLDSDRTSYGYSRGSYGMVERSPESRYTSGGSYGDNVSGSWAYRR